MYSKQEISYLLKFLPLTILEYVINSDDKDDTLPIKTVYSSSTIMFADISGFTRMSEKYSNFGPIGTEQIAWNINRYFEQLIKIIRGQGGDIIKFAGDALFVLFKQEINKQCVINCALEIQQQLNNLEVVKNVRLSVKIGIGFGEAILIQIGDPNYKYHYTVYGEAVEKAISAEKHCQNGGEILISTNCWKSMKIPKQFFVYESVKNYNKIIDGTRMEKKKGIMHFNQKYDDFKILNFMNKIEKYIPNIVYNTIKYKKWINESRFVSVMFIKVKTEEKQNDFNLLQNIISKIQKITHKFGGSLSKFIFDDKGSTFLIIFGDKGSINVNNDNNICMDAILCALAIKKELEKKNIISSCGVTFGKVFCGILGSMFREYTVLGDKVNLAARLMSFASSTKPNVSTIYIDSQLVSICNIDGENNNNNDITFKLENSIILKGMKRLNDIYSVELLDKTQKKAITDSNTNNNNHNNNGGIIHQSNIKSIISFINSSITENTMQFIIGDKLLRLDLLILKLKKHYQENQTNLLHFINISNYSQYFFGKHNEGKCLQWSKIFKCILQQELRIFVNHDSFKPNFKKWIKNNDGSNLLKKLSSINCLIEGDEFKESDENQADKFDECVEILIFILEKVTQFHPLLICVYNLQNQSNDDQLITSKVLKLIKNKKINVHLLFTFPPIDKINNNTKMVNKETIQFIKEKISLIGDDDHCNIQEFYPWNSDQQIEFLLTYFNVQMIQDNIINYLWQKCRGRMDLLIKFCNAINKDDSNFVIINNELVSPSINRLVNKSEDISDLSTPMQIQQYFINNVIDKLTIDQILLCKIASVAVIGGGALNLNFDQEILIKLFIKNINKDLNNKDINAIKENLNILTKKNILNKCDDDNLYEFQCGLLLDSIYQTMLYKDTKKLHINCKDFYDDKIQRNIQTHHLDPKALTQYRDTHVSLSSFDASYDMNSDNINIDGINNDNIDNNNNNHDGVLIIYVNNTEFKGKKPTNFYVVLVNNFGKSKSKTSTKYSSQTFEWNEYLLYAIKEDNDPIYKLQIRSKVPWGSDIIFSECDLPISDISHLFSTQQTNDIDQKRQSLNTSFIDQTLKMKINKKYHDGNDNVDNFMYLRVKLSYISLMPTSENDNRSFSMTPSRKTRTLSLI